MKSIYTALLACACISLFCFSTCSKKDDDPKKEEKLTSTILTGINGDRYWIISKLERTYYSAGGGVDSTSSHEYASDEEYMKFSAGNDYTENKPLFISKYPLEDYTPDFGYFTVSNDGTSLTLVCSDLFACNEDREGTWTVKDYGVSGYGASFNIERTVSLDNGRHVKIFVRLYSDTL